MTQRRIRWGYLMHSKPSLSASPAKKPSGALLKPHLKTLHHCAAWITRGCGNVPGNNATWWTPRGWSAPAKFLKQREPRVTDSAVAASLWDALETAHSAVSRGANTDSHDRDQARSAVHARIRTLRAVPQDRHLLQSHPWPAPKLESFDQAFLDAAVFAERASFLRLGTVHHEAIPTGFR